VRPVPARRSSDLPSWYIDPPPSRRWNHRAGARAVLSGPRGRVEGPGACGCVGTVDGRIPRAGRVGGRHGPAPDGPDASRRVRRGLRARVLPAPRLLVAPRAGPGGAPPAHRGDGVRVAARGGLDVGPRDVREAREPLAAELQAAHGLVGAALPR